MFTCTAPDEGVLTRPGVLQHRSLQSWDQTHHPAPHPPHSCTHIQNDGQRGPSSKGGPSLPFTVSRTVAFHSWGWYRQRQPYMASQASCWCPCGSSCEEHPFSGLALWAHSKVAPLPLWPSHYTVDTL